MEGLYLHPLWWFQRPLLPPDASLQWYVTLCHEGGSKLWRALQPCLSLTLSHWMALPSHWPTAEELPNGLSAMGGCHRACSPPFCPSLCPDPWVLLLFCLQKWRGEQDPLQHSSKFWNCLCPVLLGQSSGEFYLCTFLCYLIANYYFWSHIYAVFHSSGLAEPFWSQASCY